MEDLMVEDLVTRVEALEKEVVVLLSVLTLLNTLSIVFLLHTNTRNTRTPCTIIFTITNLLLTVNRLSRSMTRIQEEYSAASG